MLASDERLPSCGAVTIAPAGFVIFASEMLSVGVPLIEALAIEGVTVIGSVALAEPLTFSEETSVAGLISAAAICVSFSAPAVSDRSASAFALADPLLTATPRNP